MGESIPGATGEGKMGKKKLRVLLGRFDLDGHDRGISTVINALMNAGMEVIYIHFSNPKEVAKAAIEEDVDLIGLTSSLGQHLLVSSGLLEELNENKVNIPVIVGGVIPDIDMPKLLSMGIKKVFSAGSKPQDVVAFVSHLLQNS